mmetsp:Transcript_2516/g.4112  ORF Transcript_2516/g.4112 Transcript_2516/m.4112 type:complete len:111 (+) Transcript_2516:53-385(+)
MRRPKKRKKKQVESSKSATSDEDDSSSKSLSSDGGEDGGVLEQQEEEAEQKRENALRLELDRLNQLPKASRYVRFKKPIIERCLSILAQRRRTKYQQSQLEKLLSQLELL